MTTPVQPRRSVTIPVPRMPAAVRRMGARVELILVSLVIVLGIGYGFGYKAAQQEADHRPDSTTLAIVDYAQQHAPKGQTCYAVWHGDTQKFDVDCR